MEIWQPKNWSVSILDLEKQYENIGYVYMYMFICQWKFQLIGIVEILRPKHSCLHLHLQKQYENIECVRESLTWKKINK